MADNVALDRALWPNEQLTAIGTAYGALGREVPSARIDPICDRLQSSM